MLHVSRHTNNFAPAVRASVADALADWIFIRKMAARCRLADDHDFGRILVVAFVELAPSDEPHAHRAEIVIAHGADPRHRSLIWLRRWTAVDKNSGVSVVARTRKR